MTTATARFPYRRSYGWTFKSAKRGERGAWIVVLDNRDGQAGFDTGAERWAVVCDKHSTILGARTLDTAKHATGEDFCDGCRADAAPLAAGEPSDDPAHIGAMNWPVTCDGCRSKFDRDGVADTYVSSRDGDTYDRFFYCEYCQEGQQTELRHKSCGECDGTGVYVDGAAAEACDNCGGTGEIEVERQIRCRDCNGVYYTGFCNECVKGV